MSECKGYSEIYIYIEREFVCVYLCVFIYMIIAVDNKVGTKSKAGLTYPYLMFSDCQDDKAVAYDDACIGRIQ